MNNIIDLGKLKRIPTASDIEIATSLFEAKIPELIKKHEDFFNKENRPKGIDYIISPSIKTNDGLLQLPYPQISFIDSSIPKEIRQEVSIEFYNNLFQVINS